MLYPLSYGRVPAFIASCQYRLFLSCGQVLGTYLRLPVCLKSWKWTACRRDGEEDSAQTNLPAESGGTAEAETLDGVLNDLIPGRGIRVEQELDSDKEPTVTVLRGNLTCPRDFNSP